MRAAVQYPSSVLATVLAAALLGACSSDSKKNNCPYAAVLAPTATLTTFRPGIKDDPSGELYTVGLNEVSADCSFDSDNGTTDSSLALSFKAKRAPSPDAASYRVPYYVAITQGERVLSKHDFWVNFSFAAGAPTADFSDSVASTRINLENGKKPYDYEILVGLQLTHDQLDYNKKIGRYAP
jgi:hypothetical protein